MKPMYKLLLLLFIIPISLSATNKGKYTKTKTINKEFNVTKNATLTISNKYGNVDVFTWDKNVISIKVTITTNGNDEEKVEKRLEQIDVDFDSSSNNVSAKTIIEQHSNSWRFWGEKNNVNMQINYHINMPVSNNANLSNDYGSISLDKLEGEAKINCDYGKIVIGELLNTTNSINIDYTNKSTIDFIKDGKINADYSSLHVERSGRTHLNADYSHISFGMVTVLDFNCDYGSLKISESGKLVGNSDYMHTNIGKMRGSGDFKMDYGSLKIGELGQNFKNLIVNSSYSHLKIGVTQATAFNIKAATSYSGFKYPDGFTMTKEVKNNTSKYYEGYYNQADSNNHIDLKTSYGGITFTNN